MRGQSRRDFEEVIDLKRKRAGLLREIRPAEC
jgi:hypothetical protein